MHWCLFSYRIGKNITNISTKKGLSRFVKKRRLASLMSRFPPLPLASILLPGWPAPAPPRRNCVDPPVAAHVTINVTVFPAIHVLHSFRTLRLPPLSKTCRSYCLQLLAPEIRIYLFLSNFAVQSLALAIQRSGWMMMSAFEWKVFMDHGPFPLRTVCCVR